MEIRTTDIISGEKLQDIIGGGLTLDNTLGDRAGVFERDLPLPVYVYTPLTDGRRLIGTAAGGRTGRNVVVTHRVPSHPAGLARL